MGQAKCMCGKDVTASRDEGLNFFSAFDDSYSAVTVKEKCLHFLIFLFFRFTSTSKIYISILFE